VIAHIAGLPIEELIVATSAGAMALLTWVRLHLR
jgi:hypothetical protein